MPQASAKYSSSPEPNSSTERMIDAIGQLTAPQKTATRAMAAANCAGMPNIGPTVQPSTAPMNMVGTISPPLKPKPIVTAVKIIFSRKPHVGALPSPRAEAMTSVPMPL